MKSIVITGFMGTGKTTVGKRLSEEYNLEFIDTDELIEKKAGNKKVNKIFAEFGEAHFRKLEKEVIREIAEKKDAVIATGGGAIVDKKNLAVLKKCSSIIICLTSRPDVIVLRTRNEKGARPLLNSDNPLIKIEELLKKRVDAYSKADVIIDTSDLTPDEVIIKIKNILKERGIGKD
ncbi:MAG: shikimate kinase [Nitrospirota bacterium]